MMRWPKRHGLWPTLAVLALLLALLAALQYRWIGEIGRAEAERRQSQLDRSARRFAVAFDRELSRLTRSLFDELAPQPQRNGPQPGPPPPDLPQRGGFQPGFPPPEQPRRELRAALAERLSLLSRDEHASLVAGVFLLSRRSANEITLETCALDGSGCHPTDWASRFDVLRQRLLSTTEGGPPAPEGLRLRLGGFLDDPLALVLPLFGGPAGPPGRPQPPNGFRPTALLVLELDAAVLRDQMIAPLAETHFGPLSESEFVVSVLRRADRSIVYSSAPGSRADALAEGEVDLGMPTFGREGLGPPGQPEPPPSDALTPLGRTPGSDRGVAEGSTPWVLVVRHRGGSLEHAVARVRRRNLAVGLGVLALLGAAGVLLATGAQRARSLARRQLEFVASVTHELNTPLAAIRTAGQNLADGIVVDPPHVQRYGALIEREGSRLGALVAQVLDFAGIESTNRTYGSDPVSLSLVVDEALGDLRFVLDESGFAVTKQVPDDLPAVRGDASALRRVVENLLTNVVKFASSGRRVTLRAMPSRDARKVLLRVEDAGPGIPAAERERVFEPFYRGAAAERNDAPGSGLGLSLVRRIVAAHGGRVRVEDAEGGGAAVVVELPALAPEAESVP